MTTPGVITVTMTGRPPADADSGYRFMGLHFDVDFTGEVAPGSDITITLPYDPSIPDARARNLKIKHWKNNGWDTITPTDVDTVNHTVTFVVDSLSPFAFAEASTVDLSTTMVAGFGKATDTRSEVTVDYGKSAVLVGRLAAGADGLTNKQVIVERWDTALKTWVKVADATPGAVAGEYRATVSAYKGNRTTFQMRFAGDTFNTGSDSADRAIRPKVSLGTPKAPSRMSRTKSYTVYGYLKPQHAAKSYPVRVYKWRKISRTKWKSYGYVKAVASNYKDPKTGAIYTKYSAKMRLSRAGTWKLQARTLKDDLHAATSSGYDYVKVR